MSQKFRVYCECGANFLIPATLEGRRGQCPRCDIELDLVSSPPPAPSEPSTSSLSPAANATPPPVVETPTLMGEDFHASLSSENLPTPSPPDPEKDGEAEEYIQNTLEQLDREYEGKDNDSEVHRFVFDEEQGKPAENNPDQA